MEFEQPQVTRLLHQLSGGDREAFDSLMPVVYGQLHKLASRCLQAERPGHTLPATALIHEAYMKLVEVEIAWVDRVHFYAVAARVMRRILLDHAKANHRQKRGGDAARVPIDEALIVGAQIPEAIVDLDEALTRLAVHDQRKSDIVELLFFGGLTYEETAAALATSPATVHRELRMAKAWLHRELTQSAS
ncbi:MAG TPA: sigma-70 family RNA polymerase sigma factor [Bryobacteraceae bacterium]|jgi:RNA polymerase sigma factor (TIGR02999 family)|nr:sigma-70 family RNA polymerase sigma factor [Bryobacteraceae bacterium]